MESEFVVVSEIALPFPVCQSHQLELDTRREDCTCSVQWELLTSQKRCPGSGLTSEALILSLAALDCLHSQSVG